MDVEPYNKMDWGIRSWWLFLCHKKNHWFTRKSNISWTLMNVSVTMYTKSNVKNRVTTTNAVTNELCPVLNNSQKARSTTLLNQMH